MIVRLKLIKWTLLLCAGLFCSMLVLGQDRGQERLGLKSARNSIATRNVVAPNSANPAQPFVETPVSLVFAPVRPLIVSSAVAETPADDQAASAPEPVMMFVAADRANLRAGPGKSYNVQAKLKRGAAVELVPADLGQADWMLVRTDGARGYILASLLSDKAP